MQLEKGPIDVVTGEARYSLSEEKLLRHVIQEEKLSCFLDTGDGNGMPITFLDCDSIGQTKEKALDAMYKVIYATVLFKVVVYCATICDTILKCIESLQFLL